MSIKGKCYFNFYRAALLLWMLFRLPSYSQTQTPITDQLAENFQKLMQNVVTDLVYIQTSKNIYETEEDVWFKGYVLDGQQFINSNRSKTLFVQLTEDKTEKVVWEKKYEIENGFVNGHLFLENSLAEGNYTLAGYSSHSFVKESKEFYALKKIRVVKTISQKTVVIPAEKDSIVHFSVFPEGGKLISGIQSTLAFKAVNSKGLSVDVSGTLFENNNPLQNFKSSHAGMGAIIFTPDSNKKYQIRLTEPAHAQDFSVGEIDLNGKAIRLISNSKEALVFRISQSNALQEEKIYLRLQVRGIVYSIATGVLKKELLIKIPLKDVSQGIAEVTLFNKDLLPIVERLVYVNQEQKLNIKTELDKSNYNTREQANLKIKVTDQNNQPIVAHLGLSVYDGLYQNKQDAKNIQSHFLLSTQLKGNIYNPAYYFDGQNKDSKQALDLLMLTQGWRNYVWNEDNLRGLSNIKTPIISDEIKGKIQLEKPDKKTTASLGQKGIVVFGAEDSKGKDIMMTDAKGDFTIAWNHLKKGENGYIYLQLMTPSEPKYSISVKDFSFEEINKHRKNIIQNYPLQPIEKLYEEDKSPFKEREAINKLNEVLITTKKNKIFRDKYIGKLDSLAKVMSFTTDFVCVDHTGKHTKHFGYINCPQLDCHGGGTKKPVEGEKYYQFTGYKKINDNPCGHFSVTGPTVEVIYHYPKLTEAELLKMFNVATIEGYYGKKIFYEPVYDDVTITDSTPDYRNTLFWKPDIITNELGEANITFFCSDINSRFTGNIEGVNGDGLLGSENFKFSVRK